MSNVIHIYVEEVAFIPQLGYTIVYVVCSILYDDKNPDELFLVII